ncbi:uncharacterized protein BT62DRAFT_998231 [Guyanagaster necrorhizus]|uniref:Uncharacterized protein n=1 Tax=Guyanagaster necrorhizus TaxID=856835 RepID=A0A9P8ALD9_9AGAR|nr:uncharacterized protein BT62DRAFT_998231 [Guyanagaster necrorhizus MCA 3950]KAG7439551.1 hypothetical protein BT62DRAFT_998231 [Guyanagaster necrorhizus MCA 3950]
MSRLNSVISNGEDIDELFSNSTVQPNIKIDPVKALPVSNLSRKKAEVHLYKKECIKIWNREKKRLGYRPWNGDETWDKYSYEVLVPLKEALLKESDQIIYAARAMTNGEFKQLLYLEYPWVQALEKSVKPHSRTNRPVDISDWSLKAPTFDEAKCQIAGLCCEAKAIGVPINSPEGRKRYKGLRCKYCIASRSRDWDAGMQCWNNSSSRRVPHTPSTKWKREKEEKAGEEETRTNQRLRGPEFLRDDDSGELPLSASQESTLTIHNRIPASVSIIDQLLDDIKGGYHSLAEEMQAERTRLAAEVESMKRQLSDSNDEMKTIKRELAESRRSEVEAREDCRIMEKRLSMMKKMADKAETALAS